MFYAQFMLSRRGPLAKIWLAAHWEKKLTKAQILETNIGSAVDNVLDPKDKMALRTTGHLLLGIVRIYSRKTKYLLADCNEAFIKIKMAFRPGASIDLPEDNREAAFEAITLPDVARDFESALPDFCSPLDFQQQLALNQSRIDEITIKEDVPPTHTACNWEDEFGDEGFGTTEFGRGGEPEDVDMLPGASKRRRLSGDFVIGDDPMMDEFGEAADGGRFGLEDVGITNIDDDDDRVSGMEDGAANAPGPSTMHQNIAAQKDNATAFDAASDITEATVLVQNDKERFVLGPLDANVAIEKHRGRRKRRLIVDESKAISGEEMKAQLTDYTDTVATLDLAPPTKKLMRLKETGGVDRLLSAPGLELVSKNLLQVYTANLVTRQSPDENDNVDLVLALDEVRNLRDGLATPQHPFSPVAEVDAERLECGSPNRQFDIPLPPVGGNDQQQQGPPSVSPNGWKSATSPGALPTALEEEAPEQTQRRKHDSLRPPSSPKKERRSRASQQIREEIEEDDDDEAAEGDTAQEDVPRWNKRTHQILGQVRRHIQDSEDDEDLAFSDLLSGHDTKKSAAQKFYSLLVLKKWRAINVEQEEPYGEIIITSGPEINGNF